MRRPLFVIAVVFAAGASGQAPTQAMVDLSVRVIGAVQQNGKMQPAFVGGGFLLDSKHVVATDGCCRSEDGTEKVPIVVRGQTGSPARKVWSGPGGLVILEIKDPIQTSGATLAPQKLTLKNQSAYTVVFPKDAAPTVTESKIQGVFKPDQMDVQVYRAQPPVDDLLAGGALFNACGQVIGINVLSDKGVQFAMVADALSPGLEAAGVKPPVADKECGAGDQAESKAGDKGTDKGGEKSGDTGGEEGETHLRLPRGGEWVGVGIIAALIGLAMRRDTRQQVARALTTRRQAVPQIPVPPALAVRPGKPILRGIAGQYAGASISLNTGPSILGRDHHASNLVFGPQADSVSKRHCMVRWDPARSVFVLEDLGSTNGTFLANGERIPPGQPRDLRAGDRFFIGDLRNQFELRMEE